MTKPSSTHRIQKDNCSFPLMSFVSSTTIAKKFEDLILPNKSLNYLGYIVLTSSSSISCDIYLPTCKSVFSPAQCVLEYCRNRCKFPSFSLAFFRGVPCRVKILKTLSFSGSLRRLASCSSSFCLCNKISIGVTSGLSLTDSLY